MSTNVAKGKPIAESGAVIAKFLTAELARFEDGKDIKTQEQAAKYTLLCQALHRLFEAMSKFHPKTPDWHGTLLFSLPLLLYCYSLVAC
jgi:hypothetical protein